MNLQKLAQHTEIDSNSIVQVTDSPIESIGNFEQTGVSDVKDSRFEDVLAELKRSSHRHGWFSTIATVLGSLLGIVVGTGLLAVLATLIMEGKLPHIIIDFSPTSFAMNSKPGGKGVPTITTLSGITPLCLLAATAVFGALTKRERTKLVSEISQYDDPRTVGPLISALYLRNKVTGMQAARVLKRLLPKMKPEDKDLLDKDQRTEMNQYLGRSNSALLPDDNELSLAILKAYSAIGDESEVPIVRRIAQGKGRSGKDAEIRQAAQAYLDEVTRRQEKLKEPQTLLRSSESLNNNDHSLLMPVEGVQQSDSDTLLRPTE